MTDRGDIVSYCRRARKEETGVQWSVGCRIVGFETDPAHPDKPPSVAWVICDGVSVCVATDKIRPCTSAELLAYQLANGKDLASPPVLETTEQQSFIDERDRSSVSEVATASESARPKELRAKRPAPAEGNVEDEEVPPLVESDEEDYEKHWPPLMERGEDEKRK